MASRMSSNHARSDRITRPTSDRNRVAKHVLTDARPKPAFRHHVDSSPKEILEVHDERTEVEQAAARLHAHQEVDEVAFHG